jgi:hypothetical protein
MLVCEIPATQLASSEPCGGDGATDSDRIVSKVDGLIFRLSQSLQE